MSGIPLALPSSSGPRAHSHLPLSCRRRGGQGRGEDSAPSSGRRAAWRSRCSCCSCSCCCCSSCSRSGRSTAAAPWPTPSPAPSGSCSATAARRPPNPPGTQVTFFSSRRWPPGCRGSCRGRQGCLGIHTVLTDGPQRNPLFIRCCLSLFIREGNYV